MSELVVMLVGPSGCGKSTLESGLISKFGDIKKVVSVTTRAPRVGEMDGVDYHFIMEQEFEKMRLQGELIQTTSFAGHQYGSMLSEYTTDCTVAILVVVPSSASYLKPVLESTISSAVKIIYFDISHDRLVDNMLARGDDTTTITNRLQQDNLREQMEQSGLIPDYTIFDDTLNEHTLTNVSNWIRAQLITINRNC